MAMIVVRALYMCAVYIQLAISCPITLFMEGSNAYGGWLDPCEMGGVGPFRVRKLDASSLPQFEQTCHNRDGTRTDT